MRVGIEQIATLSSRHCSSSANSWISPGLGSFPTGSAQDLVSAPWRLAEGKALRVDREPLQIAESSAAITTFIEVQVHGQRHLLVLTGGISTPPRSRFRARAPQRDASSLFRGALTGESSAQ